MKKIGIITFHHTPNYGAVLQTLALSKTIQQLGNEVEVIDYRCNEIEKKFQISKFYQFRNPLNYLKYRKELPNRISKNRVFKEFIANQLPVTKESYTNKKELEGLNQKFDYFICGSDQIWNPNLTKFDDAYFLGFVKDKKKKISYAASVGVDHIDDKILPYYTKLIHDMEHIAVRESKGSEIISRLTDQEVEITIDPTFLINKEEWISIAGISKEEMQRKERYVLVYELEISDDLIEYARRYSKQFEVHLIIISARMYQKEQMPNEKWKFDCTPFEFLSYFAKAEYVITNSFHGTAFSINFNKEFTTFLLRGSKEVNSRLLNILSLFELEDRICSEFEFPKKQIDYVQVNKKLEYQKKHGINYLRKSMNLVEKKQSDSEAEHV